MKKILPVIIVIGIAVGGGVSFLRYARARVAPGIKVANMNVGGLEEGAARAKIKSKTSELAKEKITILFGDDSLVIPVSRIATFDVEQTLTNAMTVGKSNNPAVAALSYVKNLIGNNAITLTHSVDESAIAQMIKERAGPLEVAPTNPSLAFRFKPSEPPQILVNPGKEGYRLTVPEVTHEIKTQLGKGALSPITLQKEVRAPEFTDEEANTVAQSKVPPLLELAPLTFRVSDRTYVVDTQAFSKWITLKKGAGAEVGMNEKVLDDYWGSIEKEVGTEPVNAKFVLDETGSRVKEFRPSSNGIKIDRAIALQLVHELIATNRRDAEVPIGKASPSITTRQSNTLGIEELVGVGTSNFSGSPKNRRHNIAVGAAKLNGVLIKPGEEFSLVKALGDIDASTGYLEELVIKDGKTIPEYGGGLCQVGTTTFRAALGSGLPVTERRNHAYRVPYYEPAGTDATIYSPWPDFKFMNDTSSHILIQTKIKRDDLIFEYWGKKDGRKVEQTKAKIFNVTPPPPPLYIETTELAVGEKKCTERAHSGATATFTYKVAYANGDTKTKEFRSFYKPWREVCLVGINPTAASVESVTVLPSADQPVLDGTAPVQ